MKFSKSHSGIKSAKGSLIYLPLEVTRRELVGKLFLATHLAEKGHTVLIFPADMFDRYGWPLRGTYIGKNCFRTEVPYETKFYKKMKASAINVWYLDEEGGVYPGQKIEEWKERLKMRLDPQTLEAQDKILCWGGWQAKYFTEQNPQAAVVVTGSPNFDVFDQKYDESFKNYDLEQTKGEEDYVLINTRFPLTNGLIDLSEHLTGGGAISKLLGMHLLTEAVVTEGVLKYMICKLIFTLATLFPETRFIIRPHPAEKPDFYETIFTSMDNVSVRWSGDVGSWIRRSSILIHNGCTTALQASLANRPVITYIPIEEPKASEMKLPNSIGKICYNEDEVVEYLRGSHCLGAGKELINETIEGTQSIERIAQLLNSTGDTPCSNSEREALFKFLSLNHFKQRFRRKTRAVVANFIPGIKARLSKEEKQFDFNFLHKAEQIHSVANEAMSARTSIKNFSGTCLVVFPKK